MQCLLRESVKKARVLPTFERVDGGECYELTKTDGSTLKILDFEKVGQFYKITKTDGISQLFQASVKNIAR